MTLPAPIPGLEPTANGPLIDRFGRQHTYLRLSLTDRCNYRCTYCMPATGFRGLPRRQLMTTEEVLRLVKIFVSLGVDRVRLTGGEPTIRRDLVDILRGIRALGIQDLSMTTNGHLLAARVEDYAEAGLARVNISIDSVDAECFRRLTRGGDLDRVLAGIDAAVALGLTPVKLNCVVVQDENDHEIEAMVEAFARYGSAVQVRFIEHMPFDGNGQARRHVPVAHLRHRLAERWTLRPVSVGHGGPATHVTLEETGQVVGFISPMTEHFCEQCNRLRLQADGRLRTCLSREKAPSLAVLMRDGAGDEALRAAIRGMVWQKVAGHEAHEGRHGFQGIMTGVGG